jgi:16S rRNA (adenine1518-N6/adenine1519-N6)-dimethyltransferase
LSHRPRKRFGQNFLRDDSVIARIVDCVDPRPGDHVVEIGPGQGALTAAVLPRIGALDAIELDRDLIEPLQRKLAGIGELRIHQADALRFDVTRLYDGAHKLRVIGNLPYNISTPLLFHLLEQAAVIRDMHFMLQKEVVDRMAAPPGSKTYGRLSVMLQVSCDVTPLFDIGPEAFYPSPKVDSSVVRLMPLAEPLVSPDEMAGFSALVASAFAQRRKTLRNNLRNRVDEDVWQALAIDPGARSETLEVGQFVALHSALRARAAADAL